MTAKNSKTEAPSQDDDREDSAEEPSTASAESSPTPESSPAPSPASPTPETSVPSSPPGAETAKPLPLVDRWWFWAAAGLAFAAFIGFLHVFSSGGGGD